MSFFLSQNFGGIDKVLFGLLVGTEFFNHSDYWMNHFIALLWEVSLYLEIWQ